MTSKLAITEFFRQKNIAVVGVSRTKTKFGNTIFRELKKKGHRVIPVNPKLKIFDELICYPNLDSIPDELGGSVICVSPDQTANIIEDAAKAGVQRIWIQKGAESEEALQLCEQYGIQAIHGECILMFAEPVRLMHKLHWLFRKMLGKLPQ